MTTIVIEWTKFAYNEEQIKKLSTSNDYGLYQIYGWHPAYGKNALLYIGRSVGQPFAKRLYERWDLIETYFAPHTIRVGRIVKDNKQTNSVDSPKPTRSELIRLAEKLLLHTHAPALNKQDISGLLNIKNENDHIHIINWGDFGTLLPELSTYRCSYKYWECETPLTED